jgi:hypothetical protein
MVAPEGRTLDELEKGAELEHRPCWRAVGRGFLPGNTSAPGATPSPSTSSAGLLVRDAKFAIMTSPLARP